MSTVLAKESSIAKSIFLSLIAEHGVASRSRGLMPATEMYRLRKQEMTIRDIVERAKRSCRYDKKFLAEPECPKKREMPIASV